LKNLELENEIASKGRELRELERKIQEQQREEQKQEENKRHQ
jgi:hypothetical protein